MNNKKYKVTCLKCKKSSRINIINDTQVMYEDILPIIAARFRNDFKWGFECSCGNDSRLSIKEKDQVNQLVSGTKQQIADIVSGLKIKDELKFRMELA